MASGTAICLMGPTASGKTGIALRLAGRLPVDVISVDSAMVYRGMDIGTAKPDRETLERVPHALIDIREPEAAYSAGEFVRDAGCEIERSLAAGRLPLLVGGTMMYFRALMRGIANVPRANAGIRAELDARAEREGWPALHAELARIDPQAAARIQPNDSQRIQRALEVFRASGRPLSAWHADTKRPPGPALLRFALLPAVRHELHERIEQRLEIMMKSGFVDEVRRLRERPGLTADSPAMRAVGYRQLWSHLDGHYTLGEARERALFATRQLAKRQYTWLRSEPDLAAFDPLEGDVSGAIAGAVQKQLDLQQAIVDNPVC